MHPFDSLVQRDDADIRVAEAALYFARDHCPDLKPLPWLRRLDAMARRVASLNARDPVDQAAALRAVLVEEEELAGDLTNYCDPRNSHLNEVLARRKGIPISLSAVWLDVCRQLQWPFAGVGLPGHYIIRCTSEGTELLVDPFRRGRLLRRADCERLVACLTGQATVLSEDQLAPVSNKAMLGRMLQNLYAVYSRRHAWYNAACVIARLMALEPETEGLREHLDTAMRSLATLN